MNWRNPHRLTGVDILVLFGFLVGVVVAAVVGWALALWVLSILAGG